MEENKELRDKCHSLVDEINEDGLIEVLDTLLQIKDFYNDPLDLKFEPVVSEPTEETLN